MLPGIAGRPARKHRRIAAKAVCFKEALAPEFTTYAKQVVANAKALAAGLMDIGFTVVSGGTDNHLMLVDLRNRRLTGKLAQTALDAAAITVNKNTVPKETQSPFVTSGIRLGTAAVTTRGMKEPQMQRIAQLIDWVLQAPEDPSVAEGVRADVYQLTASFPLYPLPG